MVRDPVDGAPPADAIRDALRAGPGVIDALAARWSAEGRAAPAWSARCMAAALRMDLATLDALAADAPEEGDDAGFDPALLQVWTTWWTRGPLHAAQALARAEPMPRAEGEFAAAAVAYLRGLGGLLQGVVPASRIGALASLQLQPLQQLWTLELAFNGMTARLIVDTGAPSTLLERRFAERAGLRIARAARPVRDGGGTGLALQPALAEEVTGAGFVLQGVPLDVADVRPLGCDGILSPQSLWRDCAFTLHGPAATLSLAAPAAALPHSAPLFWREGSPCVRARVGAASAWLLLDTGAGANLLTEAMLQGLGLQSPAAATLSPTAAGTTPVRTGPTLPVTIGDARPEAMHLLVKPAAPSLSLFFPPLLQGYVGTPWFREREVAFAADRRTISFSAARPACG